MRVFKEKSYYTFGCLPLNDLQMAHLSVSRYHAAMIIDSKKGICIIDLGSKAGTKVNDEKIENFIPVQIATGNTLSFGYSTRSYKIEIDFNQVED